MGQGEAENRDGDQVRPRPHGLIVSLLALSALLFTAPVEASLSRVSAAERAIEAPILTRTAAAPEPSEFSLFEGHKLTAAAAESERAPTLHPLAAVSLLDERVQCELATSLEASYPKTRYRVFELLGTPILGVERGVSLELQWGSGEFRTGLTSGTVVWLSQDPLGDQDSPNLYGFVGMRPHEKTDPLGLMSEGDMLGRYLDDLDVMPRAEAQARDRARRALSAEMDAQERAGRPSIAGSVWGEVWGWATGKGRQAQAASDRIENVLAGGARDLSTNVIPPSTRRVDTREHRLPSEYGGGPTANDRLARAQNELSTTAGDVAEGGTRFGYQTGRDYFILGTTGKALEEIRALRRAGRAGRQARLRELLNDPGVSAADRGWIQQELNEIERGKRKNIRVPPGSELSHERGREAAKGYSYRYSNLQDEDLHKIQHKYDDFGRKNPERPSIPEE
jgi:Bacterial toxin 8